jgi:predicted esterase
MTNKRTCVFAFLFFVINAVTAQTGKIIRFTSSHAMFPDTARAKGHDYNGKHYDASTNYNDSSVLIYVPKGFTPKEKINLVFWFHGWGNSIDSAIGQYQLLQQFDASARNAVFVFPEGPKNAPDSYGGKLEQPQVFQQLVREVGQKLYEGMVIRTKTDYNNLDLYDITLAGHSGAYRVISRIINKTPVSEVVLFDAMYGGNDAYLQWLSVPEHRFINIYTKDGGTFDNSHLIMKQLTDSLRMPMISVNEDDVSEKLLRDNNKLFMFSSKGHNEVITNNRNWERFLRNVPAKR